MAAKEQLNAADVLQLLESSDLQQLEQVKAFINHHLNTDRGSGLIHSLVEYYLETGSPQATSLLCSVREPHDKHLLDKLNESLTRPSCRLASLTLLGHIIHKQPSWVHKITKLPLLPSLLKCLKTDSDVVVLITGVLVLITLLPIIPQAGRQHIYDFFDIFGRLASWSLRNPGHAHGVYLIHLHASVYSLFHRLYGMYPCNFISYLRSHYSMKENMDTFQEVVKPMLEHVRVHPELVTGTQDYELDPSRWKHFEIHDIVIECAKVSLDPKESSCEEGYSSTPDPLTPRHHPGLDLTFSPYMDLLRGPGSSTSTPLSIGRPPLMAQLIGAEGASQHSSQTSFLQSGEADSSAKIEGLWSPSSECGLTTPPTSRGISPANISELSRTSSSSAVKCPSSASTPVAPSPANMPSEEYEHVNLPGDSNNQLKEQQGGKVEKGANQPIGEGQSGIPDVINKKGVSERVRNLSLTELSDFIKERDLENSQRTDKEREEEAIAEELLKLTHPKASSSCSSSSLSLNKEEPQCLASTPDRRETSAGQSNHPLPWSFRPCFAPIESLFPGESPGEHSPYRLEEGAPALFCPHSPRPSQGPAPPYEPLFQLALPRAAPLFVGRKTEEVARKAGSGGDGERGGEEVKEEDVEEEEQSFLSPLEVLDRLILHGHEAHSTLMKRLTMPNKSVDWSHFGGKPQSVKSRGSTPGEELQTVRSQLLLLHSQLLYERYKRQQHAMRNRRLLRRVINATALEEQNHSMKAQLKLQDVEIQSLRASLEEEQRRYSLLRQDTQESTARLHSQIQHLQLEHHEYYTKAQKLQSELQECQSGLGDLEAELQKANNEAYNAEHQLTQLSLKLSSSEELQQQMFLLNKQLLLLGQTNRLCVEEIERSGPHRHKELSMMLDSLGKELQQLRQGQVEQSLKLDAANQRTLDLENQLAKKEHLILEQKRFLEDIKTRAKNQLAGSDSRYLALKRISQTLQTEMLQLYSQLDLSAQGAGRPNGSSVTVPTSLGRSTSNKMIGLLPPSSSSLSILNGGMELLSSPLSLSPVSVGSCPTEGSFLGIHARELFRKTSESQGEEEEDEEEEEGGKRRRQRKEKEEEEMEPGLEVEEGGEQEGPLPGVLLQASPPTPGPGVRPPTPSPSQGPGVRPPGPSQGPAPALGLEGPTLPLRSTLAPHALTQAVRQRRHELCIMDYNETQPHQK